MDAIKLRRAFKESDFDLDGHLNEFEINHFGYLLFGHRNQGDLYQAMCDFCGSNPLFGLNFESILKLFPVNEAYDSKEDLDEVMSPRNVSRKKKAKKSKRKRDKRKKDRKRKRNRNSGNKERESVSITDGHPLPLDHDHDHDHDLRPQTGLPSDALHINGATGDVMDDLDVAELADLPLSVHDDDDGGGHMVNASHLRNEKGHEAESNLLHIRHISAFVMSGLRDSSDSEEKERDDAVMRSTKGRDTNGDGIGHGDGKGKEEEMVSDENGNERESKEEVFRLEMAVSEWKDRFNELEQNRTNISERYQRLQKEYRNLENEHSVKVKQFELEEMKQEEHRLERERAERERVATEEKVKALRSDRDGLKAQNEELNESISTMQESLDNLNDLFAEKTKQIGDLRERLEAAKEVEAECMQQIDALKAVEPERSELAERVETMRQSVTEWKAKHRELTLRMEAVERERDSIKVTAERYEEQLATAVTKTEYESVEAGRARMEEEVERMRERVKEGERKEAESGSKVVVLNSKLEEVRSELNAARSEHARSLERERREREKEVKRVRAEYESKVSALSLEIEDLKERIAAMRRKEEETQRRNEESTAGGTLEPREALMNEDRPSAHRPELDLTFFAVSSTRNEEEDPAEFDLSKYTNYRSTQEDELENVKINISDMDLSMKQKVILMKARMAANEEDEE